MEGARTRTCAEGIEARAQVGNVLLPAQNSEKSSPWFIYHIKPLLGLLF
jgi:hypothetical protein